MCIDDQDNNDDCARADCNAHHYRAVGGLLLIIQSSTHDDAETTGRAIGASSELSATLHQLIALLIRATEGFVAPSTYGAHYPPYRSPPLRVIAASYIITKCAHTHTSNIITVAAARVEPNHVSIARGGGGDDDAECAHGICVTYRMRLRYARVRASVCVCLLFINRFAEHVILQTSAVAAWARCRAPTSQRSAHSAQTPQTPHSESRALVWSWYLEHSERFYCLFAPAKHKRLTSSSTPYMNIKYKTCASILFRDGIDALCWLLRAFDCACVL